MASIIDGKLVNTERIEGMLATSPSVRKYPSPVPLRARFSKSASRRAGCVTTRTGASVTGSGASVTGSHTLSPGRTSTASPLGARPIACTLTHCVPGATPRIKNVPSSLITVVAPSRTATRPPQTGV